MNSPAHPELDFHGYTILIVDDTPLNLGLISKYLNRLGFNISVAQDGESALEKARYARPDLILLDVRMPGIDGFETCRRLKAEPLTEEIPVIFMTALTETDNKVIGFNAGGVDYITKPFQLEEVGIRVKTHLGIHAMRRQLEAQNVQLQQEIAERNQAEAALRAAHSELELRVQQRTAQLAHANASLKAQIVEREQVEVALRESEFKNRAIFKAIPDLMFRMMRNGLIIDFRASLTEDLVLEPQQVIGSQITAVMPPAISSLILEHINKALDTGQIQMFEFNLPVKRGVQDFETRLVVSGKEEVLAIVRNVTERRQAEAALRQSELTFRRTFASIPDAAILWELQADGRIIMAQVNTAAKVWTENKIENFLGTPVELFFNHVTEPAAKVKRAFATGEPQQTELCYRLQTTAEDKWQLADYVKVSDNLVLNVIRDITEQKQREQQIKANLAEKEILLRELYHRTKNNMQVIASFLELHAAQAHDPHILHSFKEMENRIYAMALVHQKLYQAQNLSSIDLKEYIGELVSLLLDGYQIQPQQISVVLNLEYVPVLLDTAIPCGLIINELISNALKHAFPNNRDGEVRISLAKRDGSIWLEIADNGVGVPPGFDFRGSSTLGLQTVFNIGEHQLQGRVTFEAGAGVTCQVQFNDDLYNAGV